MGPAQTVERERPLDAATLTTLENIQDRLLWLATTMVHHANHVRENRSGIKVGGHQSSSASVVSMMTALYFSFLEGPDRVLVKPHSSPVLHAINYLLGYIEEDKMTRLRTLGGVQSYPSRVKDPGRIDFSGGSVGIGATQTIWSALAHRYVAGHFDVPTGGRQVAMIGDAELDEGAIWEALLDPMVSKLGEMMWIIDLNRQSLDRIVPDIAVDRLIGMFESAGWKTQVVKYGRFLRELFERPGGENLRRRIDTMPNEEYQRLLRSDAQGLREHLPGSGRGRRALEKLIADLDDNELHRAIRDLGGHDLHDLITAFQEADKVRDQPTVIFAYTIKAWGLPTEGHPANHSALLSVDQWHELARRLGTDPENPWKKFEPGTAEAELCEETADRLRPPEIKAAPRPAIPADVGRAHRGKASTQQAFGRFFVDLSHAAPEVAEHVVTVSPDVASSTNVGGWINRQGIWYPGERIDWFADDGDTLVRWRESEQGRHIELGIAELNLVGLLAELGSTWSRDGQPLFPVGTLYDPFVGRALEPWSFGMYAGGQSILVGTPSGISLAPEGGAHQSINTPSIGIEQPTCTSWEPAFGQDLEWALLAAFDKLGRPDGGSAYFRLSTRPIDQSLAAVPEDPAAREQRRLEVLSGGYLLRKAAGERPAVTLVGMGVTMPEVIEAADQLAAAGIESDVICLTSADLVFRALQARRGLMDGDDSVLDRILPAERMAPIVTVCDAHPHSLAFLGSINGVPVSSLGVTEFGQSGDIEDLYRYYGIDTETIVGAAIDLTS